MAPKKLYCFGGRSETNNFLSSVSEYDFETEQWTFTTPMTITKEEAYGGVIGNRIYLCGGDDERLVVDTMQAFDCSTKTWINLRELPSWPRGRHGTAVLDGFLYVAGGNDGDADNLEVNNSVVRYCVETNEWQNMKPMLTGRFSHKMVELNGFLYAIGGHYWSSRDYDRDIMKAKTVERYDPKADEWTMVASTEHEQVYSAAASHGGKIYVHGDQGFEVYCPDSNKWATLEPIHDYKGSALVSVGEDKLWSLGGGSNYDATAKVFEYSIQSGKWKPLPDMNQARRFHSAYVI